MKKCLQDLSENYKSKIAVGRHGPWIAWEIRSLVANAYFTRTTLLAG